MFAGSDAYERFMGRWSAQLAQRFATFAEARDGQAVLDVGCGTGALAAAIAARTSSASIVGIDRSPEQIRAADLRATGRVRFLVGDAQRLPCPDASFDLTLSLLAINFIPDRERALREMIRVTRPGGTLAAAVWDYGDGMQMLRLFWDEAVGLMPGAASHDERQTPLSQSGQVAAFWLAAGLRAVHAQPLTISQRFEPFDDY